MWSVFLEDLSVCLLYLNAYYTQFFEEWATNKQIKNSDQKQYFFLSSVASLIKYVSNVMLQISIDWLFPTKYCYSPATILFNEDWWDALFSTDSNWFYWYNLCVWLWRHINTMYFISPKFIDFWLDGMLKKNSTFRKLNDFQYCH